MSNTPSQDLPVVVNIGNWLFHTRNWVFPLTLVILFVIFSPKMFLGNYTTDLWLNMTGVFVAIIGLAFRSWVIGLAYIKRGGVDKKVYADTLVIQGMFGVCRNPLYVGNMLTYLGLFIIYNNPWVYLFGVGVMGFYYWCIVRAEETYLINKFGDEYHRYCDAVPRFSPDFRLYRNASQDMNFNWKRAVAKDYSTVSSWLVAITLLHLYETWSWQHTLGLQTIQTNVLVLLVIGILTLLVRAIKKGRCL